MSRQQKWETTCLVRESVAVAASPKSVAFTATRCKDDPRTHPIWLAAEFGEVDVSWSSLGVSEPVAWREQKPTPGHVDLMALPPAMVVGYEVRALDRPVCLVVRLSSTDAVFSMSTRTSVAWIGGDQWLAVAFDPRGIGSGSTIRRATLDAFDRIQCEIEADRREEARLAAATLAEIEREREMEEDAKEEARSMAEREAALAVDQIAFTF